MDHTTASALVTALDPLIRMAALAIGTWIAKMITDHVKSARGARALANLQRYADAAVATVYQGTVAALKDPSRPGSFTTVAQAAAKQTATDLVHRAAASVMDEVRAAGQDPDATLAQFIEKAVADLNAKVTPTARTTPTPDSERPTPTAPQRKLP